MRVLLLQPPIRDFYLTRIRTYPLGLLFLASKIKKYFDVKVLDLTLGKPKIIENREFPELDIFFNKNKISPFSLFKAYKHFGMDFYEIKKVIEREKPQIIGISSNFSSHFEEVKEIINISKETDKEIKVVLGGYHPTIFPMETLSLKGVDFLIRGEGETPFFELLKALSNKKSFKEIEGISFKEKDKIYIKGINYEKNIDLIPERDLIDSKNYKWGKSYFSSMITTRGCPFKCAFCGKLDLPFRMRSIKNIEEEIEILNKENIKFLSLEDEVLGLDKKFFKEILNLFKGKDFKLSCMNGIYLGVLNEENLREIEEAGFVKLNLSLVDISKENLKREKRDMPKEVEDLNFLKNYNFLVEVHFIVGLPKQKIENVIETMIYLMENKVLLAPSIYYLSPQSYDFKKYYKGEEYKYFRSSALKSPNPLFKEIVIYTFLYLSRFINYIKNAIDFYEIGALEDLSYLAKDEREKEIIRKFLLEKKFYYYDEKLGDYFLEPLDQDLLKTFFEKAKGKKITGYKKNKFIYLILKG